MLEHHDLRGSLHDEIDPLGHEVKLAMATIGRLETLGLQKLDISFPRCIVLGMLAYRTVIRCS